MNKFSCSLPCTCMTIIDYLFLLLTAYLEGFIGVYAKLVDAVVVHGQ